ncbi:hypothetical protein GQ43DRAFT_158835 [Delitschia confertaspora ATCC 74209]|uniref:Uncharacterized protein n=1 Tax=Delitschia confertaspora ATCC 74209 TaxID=1513339 RepID=A0A9P4JU89_9PLEO|nr:hypothetical protein GQ43DRAFT_158835 [Delitschia confertaspora ATCC 74209]
MSSIIGRAAFRATPRLRTTGAKRDPELIILFGIMCGIFGLAGWHFSSSPTSSSSERKVAKAEGSEPWKEGSTATGKYQYHPGGNVNAPPKDAPSALNTVIVPNVNLPKSLHDQYNKYGKDDF